MSPISYIYKRWLVNRRALRLQDSSDQEEKKEITRDLYAMHFSESEFLLERKVLTTIKKDGMYFLEKYTQLPEFNKRYDEFFKKHPTLQFI